MSSKTTGLCKNCNSVLEDNASFCSRCGQSILDYKQPFFSFFSQLFNELMDVDGRMFATFKTLIMRPGALTIAYNNGQRAKYSPPFRMYIIISILFFMMPSLYFIETNMDQTTISLMNEQYPRIMFALIPIFALLLQLLYRKTYYISNLVFSVHVHSFSYLLLLILLPMESLADKYLVFIIIQTIILVYLLWYLLLAIKNNYAENWGKSIAKYLLLLFSYLAIIINSINLVKLYII